MPLEITSINNCCAGYQWSNFPGAHRELGFGRIDKKAWVINFLNQMNSYKGVYFWYAFVNDCQNYGANPISGTYYKDAAKQGMNGVFEYCGWKLSEVFDKRLFLYTFDGPSKRLSKMGMVPYVKQANIRREDLEEYKRLAETKQISMDIYNHYKNHFDLDEKMEREWKPKSDLFYSQLKAKFNIDRTELNFKV